MELNLLISHQTGLVQGRDALRSWRWEEAGWYGAGVQNIIKFLSGLSPPFSGFSSQQHSER